jgi:hypothetical protein
MSDDGTPACGAVNDDLLVVERRDQPRVLEGMRGRYTIDGWRDSQGRGREFDCELLKMSPNLIKLAVPVTGTVGNRIVVRFEDLGAFEGAVVQVLHRSLVMKIVCTLEDKAKVANKLAWITDAERPEARRYPRIVPNQPESTLAMPGNVVAPCQIIDYSLTGAAVYADVQPALGSVVKVGKILGHVVRHFGGGFAVHFVALQDVRVVEAAILASAQGGGPT